MKKFVAAILMVIMVFSVASVAMAKTTPFNIVTESTNILQIGTSQYARSNSQWHLNVDMTTSNVSDTHRAVTRVHKGANAVSATWVYSGFNDTPHGYNSGVSTTASGLTFRGRLDNRDSGLLEFHGSLNY